MVVNKIGKLFESKGFENFIPKTSEQKRLLDLFVEVSKNKCLTKNVIIHGGVGVGKTHLCNALTMALSQKKGNYFYSDLIKITTSADILKAVRQCWNKDADKYDYQAVEDFKTIPILIVDEIGVQYGSESEKIELYNIFNARYEDCLYCIICSNLKEKEMCDVLGLRTWDRISGGAYVFEIIAKSERK